MNVLSLCDGMSCGHIALDKVGIKVDNYFAAEIKSVAIKVTKANYPNTIFIGDVNKITYKDGILKTENEDYEIPIDMVIFGSPCQSFSIAMKTQGRVGLEDKERSGLFLECYRILKEVNPKYFFMENVASMKNEDRDFISKLMGVEPVRIDSMDFGPAMRKRYYWTNIPFNLNYKKVSTELADILDDGWTDRKKARALLASDSRPLTTPIKMFHRYFNTGFTTLIFKSEAHYHQCIVEISKFKDATGKVKAENLNGYTGDIFDGVRYMTQNELEKCQTVPVGYTSCLTRNEAADVLGDGWTIDVIAWFFQFIKE